jgi:hypothetical protein
VIVERSVSAPLDFKVDVMVPWLAQSSESQQVIVVLRLAALRVDESISDEFCGLGAGGEHSCVTWTDDLLVTHCSILYNISKV